MYTRTLILYHDRCSDGAMSAYIAKKANPLADLMPVDYALNKKSPDYVIAKISEVTQIPLSEMTGAKLFIIDFCFDWKTLKALSKVFGKIVVLDHHLTAFNVIKALTPEISTRRLGWNKYSIADNAEIYFCMQESGSMMAWKYFNAVLDSEKENYRECIIPSHVKWVDDRDLWKFKYEETKFFHSGMALHKPFSYKRYDQVLSNVHQVLDKGKTIEEYQNCRMGEITDRKIKTITIRQKSTGTSVSAVMMNSTAEFNCDLCYKLLEKYPESHIALTYGVDDMGMVTFSVRSRVGYDSSWFAISNTGGGHAQASGFMTDLDTLGRVLTTHSWLAD